MVWYMYMGDEDRLYRRMITFNKSSSFHILPRPSRGLVTGQVSRIKPAKLKFSPTLQEPLKRSTAEG